MKTGNCTMPGKTQVSGELIKTGFMVLKAKACSEQLKEKIGKKRTGESENIIFEIDNTSNEFSYKAKQRNVQQVAEKVGFKDNFFQLKDIKLIGTIQQGAKNY